MIIALWKDKQNVERVHPLFTKHKLLIVLNWVIVNLVFFVGSPMTLFDSRSPGKLTKKCLFPGQTFFTHTIFMLIVILIKIIFLIPILFGSWIIYLDNFPRVGERVGTEACIKNYARKYCDPQVIWEIIIKKI